MHFENGDIVGDTPEEQLAIAEARILGMAPWPPDRYPRDLWGAPIQYRDNLINTLEAHPREDVSATIRGLSRLAMSQKKLHFAALDVLTQLADKNLR